MWETKHAGVASHLMMLLELRAVVDGHFPAGEVHHPGLGREVLWVQGGALGHGVKPLFENEKGRQAVACSPSVRFT